MSPTASPKPSAINAVSAVEIATGLAGRRSGTARRTISR
jgi:hypothetical protein